MPIKTSTVNQLKKELVSLPREILIQHCLRLIKYKKDNKELLHYLLFESSDEDAYVSEVKNSIVAEFAAMNTDKFIYVKKGIRRIHKIVTKHIKHSGIKETEIELLLCFCVEMQKCNMMLSRSKVMVNMYQRQLININKALQALHTDVRLDYEDMLEKVEKGL